VSDILAIVGSGGDDEQLVEELARRRPDRVTVLVEDVEARDARPLRDRLAALGRAIEQRTGAVVVGLAGSREQLRGWRFDREVRAGRFDREVRKSRFDRQVRGRRPVAT